MDTWRSTEMDHTNSNYKKWITTKFDNQPVESDGSGVKIRFNEKELIVRRVCQQPKSWYIYVCMKVKRRLSKERDDDDDEKQVNLRIGIDVARGWFLSFVDWDLGNGSYVAVSCFVVVSSSIAC